MVSGLSVLGNDNPPPMIVTMQLGELLTRTWWLVIDSTLAVTALFSPSGVVAVGMEILCMEADLVMMMKKRLF